jgi:hypothetical protein
MSPPILDRPSATAAPASMPRRRRLLLLVVAPLLVVAAVGTGVALASRTSTRPAVAVDPGTAGQGQPAGQRATPSVTTGPHQGGNAAADSKPQDSGPPSVDTGKGVAVLPDGVHHALIRNVDVAGDRITVDVVQLFLDGDAVKAAIADGKPREQAEPLTVWLRNQNPRLRTLPLAGDLRVDLYQSCDESPERRALLRKLAHNARLGVYFYTLTVRGGMVHAIKERQITPAC